MDKTSIWLNTQHGQKLYPFAFTFDQFHLPSFAQSMSKKVRYAGMTARDISTAEHSLLLSYIVTPQNAPYALVHDMGEVPFGDIPGPVKAAPECAGIKMAEEAVTRTIALGLGLTWPFPAEVDILDKLVTNVEATLVFDELHESWEFRTAAGYEQQVEEYRRRLMFLPPGEAYTQFIRRFQELFCN